MPIRRSRRNDMSAASRSPRRVLLALGWHHDLLRRGVVRFAREAGWHLRLETLRTSWLPHGWRGDGLLTNGLSREDLRAHDLSLDMPIVAMDQRFDGGQRQHGRAFVDAEAAGRMAAEHLLDRGFRDFGTFIRLRCEPESLAVQGFNAVLRQRGLKSSACCWESVRASYSPRGWEGRQKWFRQGLREMPRPVAAFAWDDVLASELVEACAGSGVAIPEDVAVLGVYNEEEVCELAPIPISSVDMNLELLGYRAAEMLDRIMRGRPAPEQPLLIPPRGVVTRRSTDILAMDDVRVSKALRCLRERYCDPAFTVDHVVEHARMSKRALYVAFQKKVGRPPHRELMRLRIARARDLVLNTRLQMKEIWEAAGFSSLHHMYQVFQREVGLPPQRLRQQHAPERSPRVIVSECR
jgi:LacI family transcriptional regulator